MKINILFFAIFLLFSISCNDQETADFEFFVESQLVIPSGLNTIETHVFVIEDVQPFLASKILAKGYDTSNISSVKPGRAELYDRFSSTNLGFIREVSIRARKVDDSSDYVELFKIDNVRLNEGPNLALLNTFNDIEDWMDEEYVDIEVRLQLRGFSPQTLSLGLDFSYAVFVDE